jgi:hypothetical protein
MLYRAMERRDRKEAKKIMKLHEKTSFAVAQGQFLKMKKVPSRTG